jgi:alpha-L-glutamate ligase-like protein
MVRPQRRPLLVRPSTLNRFGILGINSRNIRFLLESNTRSLYPYVDNKALTKKICGSYQIPTPETYAIIERFGDIPKYTRLIEKLNEFVVKPARGTGGHGIVVVVGKRGNTFKTSKEEIYSVARIRYHISTILSGLYSLGACPDAAIIEKRIAPHHVFEGLAVEGTPDVRLIIYKGTPVMAMLRLPTKASRGRANLHQGAAGVGINLETGQTYGGVWRDRLFDVHPDTGMHLDGLIIPQWSHVVAIAVKLSKVIGLQYVGIDIVLDGERGPLVLEANARPGLSVQIANRCGLWPQLKKAT